MTGTGSSVPNIPINVIASYAGNNAYLATSTTKTVYLNNYVPVSPATAVFLNKSGRTGIFSETVIPSGIGAGSTVNGTLSVTINITNNITLNEFNFGCYDLIGHAGYRTWGDPHTFIMTVQDMASGPNPTTVTTVTFNAIMPPPNSTQQDLQDGASEYYAMTYLATASASRNNDGMLLSIPFYDISGNLVPTYVNSFSITGTRSPQFKLGDVIKITLSCRNTTTQAPTSYWVYSSFNGDMCGALIATPTTTTTTTTTENIYTTSLSDIAYMGNSTTSITRSTSQTNFNISTCPAITVSMRTMVTGLYIASIGLQTGESGVFSLRVYNSGTLVLTVNFQCTLPSTRQPLFIPFSYVSQAQNPTTTTPSAQLAYISFSSGVQNPIYEPGSQFSCILVHINSSSANISYSSTSLNNGVIVSEAYGTTMLAYTKLAVVVPTTPVRGATNKTIALSATTSPTNVGGAITYSLSQNSPGWVTLANNTLTIGVNNNYGTTTVIATQPQTGLYNAATAYGSFDIIGTNSFNAIATTIISSGSPSYSYSNPSSPMVIGANIYSNNTIITGVSFAKYGGYRMSPGSSATMSISKLSSPTTILATVTFTASSQSPNSLNSNDDGNLFFIPFINGNTFNENTYPITIMPTYISSITGTITDPNALTFNAGDTILIKLSGTTQSNVLSLVGNGVSTSLVGSIISSNTVPAWNTSYTLLYSSQPSLNQTLIGSVNNNGNGYHVSFSFTPSRKFMLVGMEYMGFATNNQVDNFPMNLVISDSSDATVFYVTFNVNFNITNTVNGTNMYLTNGVYIPFDMGSSSSSGVPSITTMYGGTVISNSTINSNPIVQSQTPLTFTIRPVNNSYFLVLSVQSTGLPITQVRGKEL